MIKKISNNILNISYIFFFVILLLSIIYIILNLKPNIPSVSYIDNDEKEINIQKISEQEIDEQEISEEEINEQEINSYNENLYNMPINSNKIDY